MQRHILYVAWGFPPHRGPGAYRPLATVNELARRGHRVTVLTADLDTFDLVVGSDRSLLERVAEGVRIVRVPFPATTRDPVVNSWPVQRALDPRRWREEETARLNSLFPDAPYAEWLSTATAAAARVHETDPVDLTIATGNPYVDFAVALRLYNDEGVPYVLDDRDSWLHDVYTGELAADAGAVRSWLEGAHDTATQLWFVNPPIADAYRSQMPASAAKIRVVENGWDQAFLDPEATRPERPDGPMTASFVGTVSSTLPLRAIAEGWRLARQRRELTGARLQIVGQLGHSGRGTAEQRQIAATYRRHGLVFRDRVAKGSIAEVYAESDLLVFAKEGEGFVTSGKIYEYVATGLPIASMIAPEHDARRVLSGYPRWHDAAESTTRAFADAAVRAAVDAAEADPDRRTAALAYGRARSRTAILRRALDDLAEDLGWTS